MAHTAFVAEPLVVVTSPRATAAVGRIGRSEAVVASPNGRRLAVASLDNDSLAVIDFEFDRCNAGSFVRLVGAETVTSDGMREPHGVVFLDDHTLLVANRASELLLVELGSGATVAGSRVIVGAASAVPVRTPGSVAVQHLSSGLVEVVVCNTYAHEVNRYVLDRSDRWRVIDAERLLSHRLNIPDGAAITRDGRWLAVNNHETHQVLIYRMDELLGPDSEPVGVLSGANYPHGICFTADDCSLLISDAGLPYVYAYSTEDGDWSGNRTPTRTTRVMDDDTFNQGRFSPGDGGPKGMGLVAEGVVALTSECQPLAFFHLESFVERPSWRSETQRTDGAETPSGDAASVAFKRVLGRLKAAEESAAATQAVADAAVTSAVATSAAWADEAVRQQAEASAAKQRVEDLERIVAGLEKSTCWQLTAPMRGLAELVKHRDGRSR